MLFISCQPENNGVPATNIILNTKDISVEKGEEVSLSVTFIPSNSRKDNLTWISLDSSIATVKKGVVTGIEPGTTEIVVKCGELADTCKVTVVILSTAISFYTKQLTLTQGDSRTLIVNVEPSNSTEQIMWESSNEGVATVNQGVVRGVAEGVTTITAKAGPLRTECNVKVAVLKAVDLGLSVKWADMNIGASSPEDHGDYYAWGEIEPYYYSLDPIIWKEEKPDGYSWGSYKWANGSAFSITKYGLKIDGWEGAAPPDNNTELDPDDDVASVISGGKWRMPTLSEQDELRTKCTWVWTTKNGVNGCEVTSKRNGNSIFIPTTGGIVRKFYGEVDLHGDYWSSTLDEFLNRKAYALVFKEGDVGWGPSDRCDGRPIRPVTKQ